MSDFDLRKFFKNQYLKEAQLPKGQWVDLNDKETEEKKETIFDLISNAYAQIGGHPNYNSPDNVTGSEGDADYVVIDLDDICNDPNSPYALSNPSQHPPKRCERLLAYQLDPRASH